MYVKTNIKKFGINGLINKKSCTVHVLNFIEHFPKSSITFFPNLYIFNKRFILYCNICTVHIYILARVNQPLLQNAQ